MVNQVIDSSSTTTPLTSGSNFTSVGIDVSNYNTLSFIYSSDKTASLVIRYSNDGKNWDLQKTISNLTNWTLQPIYGKFVSLILTNSSSSNMTFLRFYTYGVEACGVVETYLSGNSPGSSTSVNISNLPKTAFGNVKVSSPKFLTPYKYSNSNWNVSAVTFASGNIKTGYESLKLQSNVLADAYGMCSDRSLLEMRYPSRAGALTFARYLGGSTLYQSGTPLEIRFTAIFDAGSYVQPLTGRDRQFIGAGNVTDATTATPRNFLGVGFSGSTNGTTGSLFGIFYYRGSVETFVPQSSFNKDTLDGFGSSKFTINTARINVFSIDIGYLGASNIDFKILYEGEWILFHRFQFPNTLTQTLISDPSLGMLIQVTPTIPAIGAPAAGTPLMANASYSTLLYGEYTYTDSHSYERSTSILANTETNIIIIRNPPTHFSKVNSILVSPLLLSLSADGTKNVIFRIYQTDSASITGAVWTQVNPNYSPVEYSTVGTYTPGYKLFTIALGKAESSTLNMSQFDILQNGDTVWVITALSTGASDIFSSISWTEIH
jgi:hypothetical protein